MLELDVCCSQSVACISQERSRQIAEPLQGGGKECSGSAKEEKNCNQQELFGQSEGVA